MSHTDTAKDSQSTHAVHYAALLSLARDTISQYLSTGEVLAFAPDNDWFRTPHAVFVTLRMREAVAPRGPDDEVWEAGDLRGCIGQITAEEPLYAAVQDAAIKSATADPRFFPVKVDELDNIVIEISVLSPFRPVDSLDDIVIGQDGLFISGDRRRGLLLPEVPLEYGWGKVAFVRALCQKAGLPPDAWPDQAQLYAFTTESFEE